MAQKVRAVTYESVLAEALTLSEMDRECLAIELAGSIPKDAQYDELWRAEIERRLRDLDEGRVVLLTDEEADAIMFGDDDQSCALEPCLERLRTGVRYAGGTGVTTLAPVRDSRWSIERFGRGSPDSPSLARRCLAE